MLDGQAKGGMAPCAKYACSWSVVLLEVSRDDGLKKKHLDPAGYKPQGGRSSSVGR